METNRTRTRSAANDSLLTPLVEDQTIAADYSVVEVAGDRLILKLGDGRMFGVPLPELPEGKLPKRAQIRAEGLDKDGVPQKAEFLNFISE